MPEKEITEEEKIYPETVLEEKKEEEKVEEKKEEIEQVTKVEEEVEEEIKEEPPKFKPEVYTIPETDMFQLSVIDDAIDGLANAEARLKFVEKQIDIYKAKDEEDKLNSVEQIELSEYLKEKKYIESKEISGCKSLIALRKATDRIIDENPTLAMHKKIVFNLLLKKKIEPNYNPEYVEWVIKNKYLKEDKTKVMDKKEAKKETIQESMQDVLSKKIEAAKKGNLSAIINKKTSIPEEEETDLTKMTPRLREIFDSFKENYKNLSEKELFTIFMSKRRQ